MRLLTFLVVSLLLVGCPPPRQQEVKPKVLTAEDFIKSMRSNNVHNIRREPNRKLAENTSAKAAYDIYVNQQQVMLLELTAGQDPENFRSFFDGYIRQGYELYLNQNLIMVARSGLHEDVLLAFKEL